MVSGNLSESPPDSTRSTGIFGRQMGMQGFIGGLFLILVLMAGLLLSGIGYWSITQEVESSVIERSESIRHNVARELKASLFNPIWAFIEMNARGPMGSAKTLPERIEWLQIILVVLQSVPTAAMYLAGYENGDLFMVCRAASEEARSAFKSPPNASIVVGHFHYGAAVPGGEVIFFDDSLEVLETRKIENFYYPDPRQQEWFRKAMHENRFLDAGPTLSGKSNYPSLMFSEKSVSNTAVVCLVVDLNLVSEFLRTIIPTPQSRFVLFKEGTIPVASARGIMADRQTGGRIRAINDLSPIMQRAAKEYVNGEVKNSAWIKESNEDWLLSVDRFQLFDNIRYSLALAIPRHELFDGINRFLVYSLIGIGGLFVVTVTLSWLVAYRIVQPLRSLAKHAGQSPANGNTNWGGADSQMKEIHALAQGVDSLRAELDDVLSLLDLIGAEKDLSKLLGQVIEKIVRLVGVEGGALTLWDGKEDRPHTTHYYWTSGDAGTSEYPPRAMIPNSLMYRALSRDETLLDSLTRDDPRAELEFVRPCFKDPDINRANIAVVPLRDRSGKALGVFLLANRIVPGQENDSAFSKEALEHIEIVAGTIGIALETKNLIQGQYQLRDALIHILAGAIDAKSPYTGGHCTRVPILFLMLLRAAHDSAEGPLADFKVDSEDGWEEARLAAWLHDCGKITTPEFVVDKATKLETQYDRIHEIRTRFEVLKRDVEIASLRAILAGADPESEQLKCQEAFRVLDDDFTFVAACNLGSENMDQDDVARIEAIGCRTWIRTIDKRLGVSRGERERMDNANVGPPPVCETLLADLPEHVIPRGVKDCLPEDDKWGFNLKVPKALYNRGELHNLRVRYGTLTEEERYKINDHITRTIIMLDLLPLPKELARVPEIAGVHHETMDGKGYPRGLTRSEMSLPGRMMAIADIFEALTASDRPYKTCKTVAEAIRIMDGMKARNHIDPDLYELFLQSDIPRRYGEMYLRPEQNDLVESIEKICS